MAGSARVPAAFAPFLRGVLRGEAPAWPELDAPTLGRAMEALAWHGVAPLVHALLRGRSEFGVPEAVARALQDAYLATAARNAVWLRDRAEVGDCLAAGDVRAAVLKGGALIGTLYEDPALRPVGDLDVLVDDGDMARAADVLAALSFSRGLEEAEELHHHWTLVRPGPGTLHTMVELHRRVLASAPYDRLLPTARLLERSRRRPDGSRELCPTDALLHLCGHLVLQHPGQERLIWVADVDRLVRAAPAGGGFWASVVEEARRALLTRSVSETLVLAVHWFASPVPDDALRALGDRPAGEQAVYARLRARAPVGREGARVWTDMQGIRGRRARLAYGLAHAFPSTDYMREWYGLDHRWQVPIYYARRILRGALHVLSDPLRRERRTAQEPPEAWMVDV